ncbi:hypothetical protein Y032_0002g1052 [Ancylostoma ceylanicum]|nr:hypothetical protein Y032_0002g1052 [Ancylostoma ceylanicum]
MKESYTEITLFEKPLRILMKRGVKQGDICSPKAFTSTLESVLRHVAEKGGFEIDGETLQMLLFADDVVLVASRPVTLQNLLNEICQLTESIGLKIHPGKTKWMKNAYCEDSEIKLNNQIVERVEHYVYLGQAIRMDNDLQLELSRRRRAGWTAFSKVDVLLKNQDIPAQTKSRLFHSNSEIKLNNQIVERVEHYVYLGQAIRMDNDLQLELSRRRRAGWTAFSKVDVLLKNQDIPAQTKSRLFHSSVLPALLYGCETWNLTKAEERSLQVTQRAMERRMLGISKMQHIRNKEIREVSQLHDIINLLYRRKKAWAGHVARMKDNRWTVRVLHWYPRTVKRPTGRPPLRWIDPLWKQIGRTWTRTAQDREKWHGCELRPQWTT